MVEPGLTVTPVEPELEPEQEPGDLSSSGPGPGQMESGEVGERNSSGIWRCFCIRRLAEEEEDLHTGCGYTGHPGWCLQLSGSPPAAAEGEGGGGAGHLGLGRPQPRPRHGLHAAHC